MFALEVEKPALDEALQTAGRAVNPRSPLPILSHLLLRAEGNTLTVTATDLDLGVTVAIPAKVATAGSLAVPAKLLGEIVTKLPAAPVALHVDGSRLKVACGRSKFEIGTLPAEEYPSLPSGERFPEIALPQKEFRSMARRVGVATAATDESRAVMTGIRVVFSGDMLVMVATDGRRLAVCEHQLPAATQLTRALSDETGEQAVIVPGKAMAEFVRQSGEEDLCLRLGESQLFATVRNVAMHCRLLEGNFPDYRRVLPTEFERTCRVGREALLAALKRMLVVAQERQSPNLIVLDLADEQLVMSANTPDLGLGQEELAVIYEGAPLRIAFNGRYMQDMLAVLDGEEVLLELQDDTRSAVLREYGQADFRYVLMPVRLREPVEEPVPA